MRPPSPASAADAVRGDIGYTPREVNRDCAGCDRSSPAATVRDQDRSDAAESAAIAEAKPTSQFVDVNGLKLHYLDWGGDGTRTIVLCHGGSAHAHWWDYLAPLLRPYGRVIALDLPGHGHSQWAPSYGPAAHIADLKAFLRDHMPTPVLLVGHSMGGEISQRIAFDCPELLEALVLVDSPHGGPPLKTRMMWRWKRRNQDGPRPEFGNAADLVRRFPSRRQGIFSHRKRWPNWR